KPATATGKEAPEPLTSTPHGSPSTSTTPTNYSAPKSTPGSDGIDTEEWWNFLSLTLPLTHLSSRPKRAKRTKRRDLHYLLLGRVRLHSLLKTKFRIRGRLQPSRTAFRMNEGFSPWAMLVDRIRSFSAQLA